MDDERRTELRRRDAAARRPRRARADELPCGNCNGPLPGDPPRRYVPRRGGRYLPVCEDCATEIDAQTTFFCGYCQTPHAGAPAARLEGGLVCDAGLMRVARGVAQVDRAVNTRRAGPKADLLVLLRGKAA